MDEPPAGRATETLITIREQPQEPNTGNAYSDTTPIHLTTTISQPHCLSSLQHMQRSGQGSLTVPSTLNELSFQRSETGAPTDGQPSSQLLFNFADLFHQISVTAESASTFTLRDCVHGTGQEEADCFINVVLFSDGG